MKTLYKQIPLVLALLLGLLTVASADRTITLAWDAQAEAKTFTVYVNGTAYASVASNGATVKIPEAATTLTVTASNDGGESLPSAPLVIPTAPANPKGVKIVKITRTTVSTP